MEAWQRDFHWLEVKHFVSSRLGKDKMPDLQAVLFLIGIQELGQVPTQGFTKEEKQDLINIGVCALLEDDGYYKYKGRDQDGWPHYSKLKNFDLAGVSDQEDYLIEKIIKYFEPIIKSSEEFMN